MNDKDIEKKRYDDAAYRALKAGNLSSANALNLPLKAPYSFYESVISERLNSSDHVLEIGAGMGENTECLLASGAKVCASDISDVSLDILSRRFNVDNLSVKVADIERLPFEDCVFDMVVSAGSLSYGEHSSVRNEIYRVLKPGGIFIAVDSLGHHPIYRLNRYVHYIRGKRSLSTLRRMPTLKLLADYEEKFGKVETHFFGSISYLTPLMNKVLGESVSAKISDSVDRIISVKGSAFKFVMVVEKI